MTPEEIEEYRRLLHGNNPPPLLGAPRSRNVESNALRIPSPPGPVSSDIINGLTNNLIQPNLLGLRRHLQHLPSRQQNYQHQPDSVFHDPVPNALGPQSEQEAQDYTREAVRDTVLNLTPYGSGRSLAQGFSENNIPEFLSGLGGLMLSGAPFLSPRRLMMTDQIMRELPRGPNRPAPNIMNAPGRVDVPSPLTPPQARPPSADIISLNERRFPLLRDQPTGIEQARIWVQELQGVEEALRAPNLTNELRRSLQSQQQVLQHRLQQFQQSLIDNIDPYARAVDRQQGARQVEDIARDRRSQLRVIEGDKPPPERQGMTRPFLGPRMPPKSLLGDLFGGTSNGATLRRRTISLSNRGLSAADIAADLNTLSLHQLRRMSENQINNRRMFTPEEIQNYLDNQPRRQPRQVNISRNPDRTFTSPQQVTRERPALTRAQGELFTDLPRQRIPPNPTKPSDLPTEKLKSGAIERALQGQLFGRTDGGRTSQGMARPPQWQRDKFSAPKTLSPMQATKINEVTDWLNGSGIKSVQHQDPSGTVYIYFNHPSTGEQINIRISRDGHAGSTNHDVNNLIERTGRHNIFDTGYIQHNKDKYITEDLAATRNVAGESFGDRRVLEDALSHRLSTNPSGQWLVPPGRERVYPESTGRNPPTVDLERVVTGKDKRGNDIVTERPIAHYMQRGQFRTAEGLKFPEPSKAQGKVEATPTQLDLFEAPKRGKLTMARRDAKHHQPFEPAKGLLRPGETPFDRAASDRVRPSGNLQLTSENMDRVVNGRRVYNQQARIDAVRDWLDRRNVKYTFNKEGDTAYLMINTENKKVYDTTLGGRVQIRIPNDGHMGKPYVRGAGNTFDLGVPGLTEGRLREAPHAIRNVSGELYGNDLNKLFDALGHRLFGAGKRNVKGQPAYGADRYIDNRNTSTFGQLELPLVGGKSNENVGAALVGTKPPYTPMKEPGFKELTHKYRYEEKIFYSKPENAEYRKYLRQPSDFTPNFGPERRTQYAGLQVPAVPDTFRGKPNQPTAYATGKPLRDADGKIVTNQKPIVEKIEEIYKSGKDRNAASIARTVNMKPGFVQRIVAKLPEFVKPPRGRPLFNDKYRTTAEKETLREAILKQREEGRTAPDIAKDLGVSYNSVLKTIGSRPNYVRMTRYGVPSVRKGLTGDVHRLMDEGMTSASEVAAKLNKPYNVVSKVMVDRKIQNAPRELLDLLATTHNYGGSIEDLREVMALFKDKGFSNHHINRLINRLRLEGRLYRDFGDG